MKADDIRLAVHEVNAPDDVLDDALALALPVLAALAKRIPWWRRLIRGLWSLVDAVKAYLVEEGLSDADTPPDRAPDREAWFPRENLIPMEPAKIRVPVWMMYPCPSCSRPMHEHAFASDDGILCPVD